MRFTRVFAAVAAAATVLALSACGDDEEPSGTADPTDEATSTELQTLTEGKLTIATGQPAYPPYVEDDKPEDGKGFEAALAYAVAEQLGFAAADVVWVRTGFDEAIQPGPKTFDFNLQQFSITDDRKQTVDFSTPYYKSSTALLAIKGKAGADATDIAGIKDLAIGVQTGTSTLEAVNSLIAPSEEPQVFNTNDDAVAAFSSGQIDLLAVDLPTAAFLSLGSDVGGVDDSVIIGQIDAEAGSDWGLLLDKDSPLTGPVSDAVDALWADGTIDALIEEWLPFSSTPVLQ